ncbi:hypothetical protein SO802_025857 [Lithocarpus litseifolius]|uniref:Endonuclease/exonuclease/phosphatase domain-containing protein n=1 Tax=Lithocarpus litseifolius TaxID=425828 RepID=A0AAW2C0G6_9ROSI
MGNLPMMKLYQTLNQISKCDLLVCCKEEIQGILKYLVTWKPNWEASTNLLRNLGWSLVEAAMMGPNSIEFPNTNCTQMNILLWNCRGALNADFTRRIYEMAVNHYPSIMVLTETRVGGERAARIIEKLPFDGSFTTETIGYAGGPLASLEEGGGGAQVAQLHNLPWLMMGDFNEILSGEDKLGGRQINLNRALEFKDCIDACNFLDLGVSGPKYTWSNPRQISKLILERIDRCFANPSWRMLFPEASVTHLPRVFSDHSPILLELLRPPTINPNKPFRFQAMWIHHPDFHAVVKTVWDMDPPLPSAIDNFTEKAKKWNREVFGNLFARKKRVLARLYGVQKAMSNNPNDFLIQLEKNLTKEYIDIMQHEEEFWALKSLLNWAELGDRNTAFFHTTTLVRRHRNKIRSIQNSVGEWITDDEGVKKHILLGFQQLFQTEAQHSNFHSDIESFSCSFLSDED